MGVCRTWDLTYDEDVDAAAVGAYVQEAVRRYPDYKANAQEVLAAARAGRTGQPARSSSRRS